MPAGETERAADRELRRGHKSRARGGREGRSPAGERPNGGGGQGRGRGASGAARRRAGAGVPRAEGREKGREGERRGKGKLTLGSNDRR
jgi:hypothetical protein